MISQFLLAVISISAVACTQLTDDPRVNRWGPVLGLCSQPFWFIAGWEAQQFGNLATSGVITLVWLKGFTRQWAFRDGWWYPRVTE